MRPGRKARRSCYVSVLAEIDMKHTVLRERLIEVQRNPCVRLHLPPSRLLKRERRWELALIRDELQCCWVRPFQKEQSERTVVFVKLWNCSERIRQGEKEVSKHIQQVGLPTEKV